VEVVVCPITTNCLWNRYIYNLIIRICYDAKFPVIEGGYIYYIAFDNLEYSRIQAQTKINRYERMVYYFEKDVSATSFFLFFFVFFCLFFFFFFSCMLPHDWVIYKL